MNQSVAYICICTHSLYVIQYMGIIKVYLSLMALHVVSGVCTQPQYIAQINTFNRTAVIHLTVDHTNILHIIWSICDYH